MTKRWTLLLPPLLLLLAPSAGAPQPDGLQGHWQGVLVRDSAETVLLLDLERRDGSWRGSFGFPEQRVLQYPLGNVTVALPNVRIAGPGDSFTLEGTLSADALVGTFKDAAGTATFRLKRSREDPPYTSEDVRFDNGNVTLSGSLYIPNGPGPYPAVIFLHGAGPEIRWGASRFFSDYFARRGIAALIYDKRGTGQSTGDWRRSDFSALAEDALAGVRLLTTHKRIDPKKIGIYGHSQGGTIAPLIASRTPDIAFVISAAGGAIPMWQGEIHSLRTQVRARGVQGDSLTRADAFIDQTIALARSGRGWKELQTEWQSAEKRGEPWAALLRPAPEDSYFWSFFAAIAEYNAADYWRKLKIPPVLVVQAGEDIYAPRDQSIAAIDAALRQAGNADFTIVVLPGAPHNFVLQPDAKRSLTWPRLYPGYADLLVSWIQYRMGKRM
jgi:pimeloyl-ACP methyl ester carboxylesterase